MMRRIQWNKEEIKETPGHTATICFSSTKPRWLTARLMPKERMTGEEFFLRGRFPGNAVVRGVILCEILAQSTCVLLADTMDDSVTPYFSGLNDVKFRASRKARRYRRDRV